MLGGFAQSKATAQGPHDVVGNLMAQALGPAFIARLRISEARLDSYQNHRRMHDRHDYQPVGSTDASQFSEKSTEIDNVIQDETGKHAVEGACFERQPLSNVVFDEGDRVGPGFRLGP